MCHVKKNANCATEPEVMQLVTECGHMTQRTHEGRGREDEGTYTHSPLETEHSHSAFTQQQYPQICEWKIKLNKRLKIKSISTPARSFSLSPSRTV